MKTFTYTIQDPVGIHARPAAALAKKTGSFESTISIRKDDKTVKLSRIMALMGLAVKCGDTVTVLVEGPDEETAAAEMEAFFAGIL